MVFIATSDKCGTGITLNRARYMIMLDESWVGAQNIQTQDRIHRLGQKKPVFIYTLICSNTIDELVHEVAQRKNDLSDYVVDDGIITELLVKWISTI